MILFMFCSGISYSIMAQRMAERGAGGKELRTRILARSVLIDFIGYILIMLNGPFAVVLPAYAMLFILALFLLRYSARTLMKLSAALFWISPPLMLIGLSLFSDSALLADMAGGPLSALAWMPVFVAGMATGRQDLRNRRLPVKFIVLGFIILIPAKFIAAFLLPGLYQVVENWLAQIPSITNPQIDPYAVWPHNTQPVLWHMLFLAMPQGGSTFELLIGTGLSFIITGLLLLIGRRCSAILKPFCSVGRAALTLYAAQFIIAWLLGVGGIDVTGINIGSMPFGDIFVAAVVLGVGCLITAYSITPLETVTHKFEQLFG